MDNYNFNIRSLTANDIFPMADIIAKCGISELKKCFTSIDNSSNLRAAGISFGLEIISIICSNISKCKKELVLFLSDLSGIEKEQLEKMPPAQLVLLIKAIVKKEEFRDFFSVLFESLSSEK